jgi:putative tryptophan/tyrosine transport system substrate-binding protein
MKRRDLIRILGAAIATRPVAARAQSPGVPIIGFLSSRGAGDAPQYLAAFRQGLHDLGFVEGQTVAVEYRFADNQYDRLPAMTEDLVRRRVAVIVASTIPAALAAKGANANVPIVFETAYDPISVGLVTSLNRPGGNVTGVTQLNVEVAPKRLELLHELMPDAKVMALLINPDNPGAKGQSNDALSVAKSLGIELQVLYAARDPDFDEVFAKLGPLGASALDINSDPFFTARQEQLAKLTVRHNVPAVYENREFVTAGGLMSYGGDLAEASRLTGVYAGRILKGEKPGDLPVQQVTKVQMFLNLKTAKVLGIQFPLSILGRADAVIE